MRSVPDIWWRDTLRQYRTWRRASLGRDLAESVNSNGSPSNGFASSGSTLRGVSTGPSIARA
eukprot:3394739-Rhodomonas_salina.4